MVTAAGVDLSALRRGLLLGRNCVHRQSMTASISSNYSNQMMARTLIRKHHDRIIYNILQTSPVVLIFLLIRFSVWPQEISPERTGKPQLASQSASLSAAVFAACANNFSTYLQKNRLVLSIPIQNLTLPFFKFSFEIKT